MYSIKKIEIENCSIYEMISHLIYLYKALGCGHIILKYLGSDLMWSFVHSGHSVHSGQNL